MSNPLGFENWFPMRSFIFINLWLQWKPSNDCDKVYCQLIENDGIYTCRISQQTRNRKKNEWEII